jgi:hypothetical protein
MFSLVTNCCISQLVTFLTYQGTPYVVCIIWKYFISLHEQMFHNMNRAALLKQAIAKMTLMVQVYTQLLLQTWTWARG